MEMYIEATFVVKCSERGMYFIILNNLWFQGHIKTAMGEVHECILATVDDEL